MKYYCKPENRIIETEELVRKYGTDKPLRPLHPRTYTQPDYEPIGFIIMEDGKYAPIQSVWLKTIES